MSEKYLTNFADQESALSYTSGDTTLVAPQVTLIDEGTELVYSKDFEHDSRIKFAKDETTGKLYFVLDGVYIDVTSLIYKTLSDKASMPVIEYQAVDLGIKDANENTIYFADRNVGAVTPQDYGMYFSWGNTDGVISDGTTISMLVKDVLYKYAEAMGVPESEVEGIMSQEGWEEMVKQELGNVGFIEGTTFDETAYSSTSGGQLTGLTSASTLDDEHDAATQWMGTVEISGEDKKWRMPTSAETMALVENTQHYYIGLDGSVVAGPFNYNTSSSDKGLDGSQLRSICFVKSGETFDTEVYKNQYDSSDKYFIEIPFAGYCNGGLLNGEGSNGSVWSRSVSSGSHARVLSVYSVGFVVGDDSYGRYRGRSVRGVVG